MIIPLILLATTIFGIKAAAKKKVAAKPSALVKSPAAVQLAVKTAKTGTAVQTAKVAVAIYKAGDKAGAKALLTIAKKKAQAALGLKVSGYDLEEGEYLHSMTDEDATEIGGRMMTYRDVVRDWREGILWQAPHMYSDLPARREGWGVYLNSLRQDGRISEHAYDNWLMPPLTASEKKVAATHSLR
jgi:hypothetical protein